MLAGAGRASPGQALGKPQYGSLIDDLWTTARIAALIKRELGVRYHRDHIGRLMQSLHWSHQKPERRALERDEQAIERWKQKDWPRVKKNFARLGAHLVFIDESGFLLIPNLVKTWAPRGHTPALRHRYRRDKISVISGISVSPKRQHLGLYYQLWFDTIRQEEVCLFLRHLLRHLRGPLIVLLDKSQTHKGEPLDQLLRQHPRLRREYFPGYAPDLNPDEGVWTLAKRDLANGCPENRDDLMADLVRSIERTRCSSKRLRGCVAQSELPPFLRPRRPRRPRSQGGDPWCTTN